MACTETFSTLVIVSGEIDAKSIESVLGIEGTAKMEKEPESKYRHRKENAVWQWSTEKSLASTDNNVHIDNLIEAFKTKASELQELRNKGCRTEIWNYWDSTGQGGPALSVKTMQDLVRLGLDIVWDIYFDDESE